jgi:hypothetical protein
MATFIWRIFCFDENNEAFLSGNAVSSFQIPTKIVNKKNQFSSLESFFNYSNIK